MKKEPRYKVGDEFVWINPEHTSHGEIIKVEKGDYVYWIYKNDQSKHKHPGFEIAQLEKETRPRTKLEQVLK